MTELTDLSDTDASNTAVTGQSTQGNVANMGGMDNLFQATLGMLSRFRNANVFRLRDNTDNTKLLAFDLSGITTATTRTQIVPDENGRQALQPHLAGHLYGLTLSNNVADATNDIDIAAGNAIDSTNAHVMTLASALTKRLDAAWAVGTGNGGLDTGAIANTTYHICLIKRVDTGVVDAIFSASASAPTLPTNYTLYRRIGSIIRAAGSIRAFVQKGDKFSLSNLVTSVSENAFGTSRITRAAEVPLGLVVDAWLIATLVNTTADAASLLITALDQADDVPSDQAFAQIPLTLNTGTGPPRGTAEIYVRTNTSAQFGLRATFSSGNIAVYVTTRGWIDTRGRLG